jgi:hypothetical protein
VNDNDNGNGNDKGPPSGRFPASRVHWNDPERVDAWLKALREQIDNALAAGEDATRRLRRRVLSRAEARRKLRDANKSLDDLLAMAERGLDTK